MPDVYVGLASNVEPAAHLTRAVAALARQFAPIACSSVYRSPALGGSGRDYWNMVARFATDAAIDDVRASFARIESAEGRDRSHADRCTLDLDLLLYGRRVDAERRLPRADILRRPFVLAPLAELAPTLGHPVTGEALIDCWQRVAASRPALTHLGPLPSAA